MRTRMLLVGAGLLLCLGTPLWTQEEVDLNALPDSPAAAPAARAARPSNLVFNWYSDMDVEWNLQRDQPAVGPVWGFRDNHIDLLVQGDYDGKVRVYTDVFNVSRLLEMTVFWPGGQSLRFGRIMIPFGEFNIHHIYGGKDDDQEVFLPQIWSDFGVSYSVQLPWNLSAETYLINGFGVADGGWEPDPGMGGNLKNAVKAQGLRLRWDALPGTLLSFSALNHEFDQLVFEGKDVLYLGADGATRLGPVALKAGGLWGRVWTVDPGSGPVSYGKWGWYTEARITLARDLDLRLRGGQMDPDDRAYDPGDEANVNAGLLWHFDVMDVNLVFFHNWETWFTGAQPNNTDQILLKLLVSL